MLQKWSVSAMIELLGCGSPNVSKILAMLHETGLPYQFREINMFSGELSDADFLRLNPNGKVPVIIDSEGPNGDSHTVFESGAILIYLAEKSGRFLPEDAARRSSTLQWLMFQVGTVGPMFGQALHFRYIAGQGNEYASRRYRLEVERIYDVLETRLAAAPYLAGDDYTIADIATYPWAGKYMKSLDTTLTNRPHVRAWIERIEQRPAQRGVDPVCRKLFKAARLAQSVAHERDLDRFFGRPR